MAQHQLDWSKFNVPVPGTLAGRESYTESLKGVTVETIRVSGADLWPVGEEVHVDLYGDGSVTYDTVVTEADNAGNWTLTVK
jgi:hypothetical protein